MRIALGLEVVEPGRASPGSADAARRLQLRSSAAARASAVRLRRERGLEERIVRADLVAQLLEAARACGVDLRHAGERRRAERQRRVDQAVDLLAPIGDVGALGSVAARGRRAGSPCCVVRAERSPATIRSRRCGRTGGLCSELPHLDDGVPADDAESGEKNEESERDRARRSSEGSGLVWGCPRSVERSKAKPLGPISAKYRITASAYGYTAG